MASLVPAAGAPDVEIAIVEAMDVAIVPAAAVAIVASLVMARLARRGAGETGREGSRDEKTSELVHLQSSSRYGRPTIAAPFYNG
jgi:hypothetical protein